MAESTSAARELLASLVDYPELIEQLPDDADLVAAGLNSGDLVRIALAIEERTGQPIGDDDLTRLHTVAGIDRVLSAAAGGSGQFSAAHDGAEAR
jgi:acyl carrier protein